MSERWNKACNACAIVKNVRVNMTKAYEMCSGQRQRLAWTNSLLSACFAASIKPPKNYHGASCSAAVASVTEQMQGVGYHGASHHVLGLALWNPLREVDSKAPKKLLLVDCLCQLAGAAWAEIANAHK